MTTTNNNDTASANQTTSSGQDEVAASTTKKRGAERQITKDDRDEDDAEVDPNAPMIKASQEVMQQRKILKVARNADGSVDWSKKKKPNPFASVQLTTTNKTTEKETSNAEKDKPTTTSIFGSSTTFSGFGSAAGGGFGSSSSGFGSGGFGSPSTTSLSFGNATGFGTVNNKESSSTAEGGETTKPLFQFAAPTSSSDRKNDKAPDADKNGQNSNDNNNDETTNASSILPTEYELQSGEEDEQVLLEVRCKTYRWGPVTTGPSATEIGEGTPSSRALAAVPPTSAATIASEKATAASPDDKPKADETETTKGDDDMDKSKNGTDTKSAASPETEGKAASPEKDGKAASPEKDSKEDSPKTEMTWHEVGVGPLRVLKANPRSGDTDQPLVVRLVQRRQVHPSSVPTKVLLNLRLFSECSVTQPSDKHCRFSTPSGQDGSATTILFKVGKATQAQELIALLEKEMPTAPSCFGEQQASSKEKDGTTEAGPTKGE